VTLSIQEGEFVVIVGPSGCGRTTFMNTFAGLVRPAKGTVSMDGEAISGPSAERGVVFQQFALFPWKTVYENVEFGLKYRGLPRGEREEIARKYIRLVKLEGFEKSFPHELSGGMKQRVAIARVYANRPQVLLMDEPFGALDAQTRTIMKEDLSDMFMTEKRTVVFITHSVEEAIYLGDRVVIMTARPGKIKRVINLSADNLIPQRRGMGYDDVVNLKAFLDLKAEIWGLIKAEILEKHIL
ncbi:MAG TPA: ABC transporter ATP-binding protein, partial [Thermodesulfobacteriota bacterium]|nr:ABC transporter ATP-binding protein [Thermodesulfobacteriota bacterium]